MSCQMSLYPINTPDSTLLIEKVLDQMDWQGVEISVGSMSTIIRGEEEIVWAKMRQLYTLADHNGQFALQMSVSNECGCKVGSFSNG